MTAPWAPYTPDSPRPWNAVRAAHLLRRAGFGFTRQSLEQAMREGPERTVDRLGAAPAGLGDFDRKMDALGGAVVVSESGSSDECATLWLHRIAETPYPLLEKATLFWHDHFSVAGARAGKALLMEQHLRLLRRNALGRFDRMLREIVRDPATRLAFEARSSPKAKPPLVLSRMLLGRWTLGSGATDADVRDAARALTGASVLRDQYHMQPADRDSGTKRVLGREGDLQSDDVAGLAASHPATATHIARRAWRWFVSDDAPPDDATIAPLAAAFAKDLDFGKLTATILRSNVFFSDAAIGRKVKSPVEFGFEVASAAGALPAPAALHRSLAALGQKLLEPPTSEGWAGGRRWLNHFTLMGRANLAETILTRPLEGDSRQWSELLLQRPARPGDTRRGREAVLAIVTSFDFQMG